MKKRSKKKKNKPIIAPLCSPFPLKSLVIFSENEEEDSVTIWCSNSKNWGKKKKRGKIEGKKEVNQKKKQKQKKSKKIHQQQNAH